MNEPKCPYCNTLLKEIEDYDIENNAGNVIFYVFGVCPHCGKQFEWSETYQYVGYKILEEE